MLRAKRTLARSLPLTATKVSFGLAEGERAIGEGFRLFLGPDHGPCRGYRVPVLRMLTRANRATGQPWLTELLCAGWPLPSLNAPPSW